VINNLDWYIDMEGDNFDGTEAPEDVVARLSGSFELLSEIYPADGDLKRQIEAADEELTQLEQRLYEKAEEDPGMDPDDTDYWHEMRGRSEPSDESVFSDVDE
jgi:hypothetical protein